MLIESVMPYNHLVLCHPFLRDFPGWPVVKTVPSRAGAAGLILGVGAKMPHALWPQNQNIKQYCNEFNKDFKMANIKKKTANNACYKMVVPQKHPE